MAAPAQATVPLQESEAPAEVLPQDVALQGLGSVRAVLVSLVETGRIVTVVHLFPSF